MGYNVCGFSLGVAPLENRVRLLYQLSLIDRHFIISWILDNAKIGRIFPRIRLFIMKMCHLVAGKGVHGSLLTASLACSGGAVY